MTFIRAPYITNVGEGVEILATENDHIVAVRYEINWQCPFILS